MTDPLCPSAACGHPASDHPSEARSDRYHRQCHGRHGAARCGCGITREEVVREWNRGSERPEPRRKITRRELARIGRGVAALRLVATRVDINFLKACWKLDDAERDTIHAGRAALQSLDDLGHDELNELVGVCQTILLKAAK